MKDLWHKISTFFEDGDLTPLAVIISVAHYGPVLSEHGEHFLIAWLVGTMIDLLHFRTVRKLFQATNTRQMAGYAFIALVTTGIALGYHFRFYDNDLLLAIPIPVGIAILAQHAASRKQEETNGLQELANQAQALAKDWQAKYNQEQERNKSLQTQIRQQQETIKAWQALNTEVQTLARFNAKLITAEQAANMIGVKDVRTVQSRAEKLNGVTKQ